MNRWAGWGLLACALASTAARADTGIVFVMGYTPLDVGLWFVPVVLVSEAVVFYWLGLAVTWKTAFRLSLWANAISGLVGVAITALPLVLLLTVPAGVIATTCGWNVWHPVTRTVVVMSGYTLASIAVEYPYLLKGRVVSAWRALGATVLANVISNAFGVGLLLASPAPYLAADAREMEFGAYRAIRRYRGDHDGQDPPQGEPFAVNRALRPYLVGDTWMPGGKVRYYDHFRWRNDYSEMEIRLRPTQQGASAAPFAPALDDRRARARPD